MARIESETTTHVPSLLASVLPLSEQQRQQNLAVSSAVRQLNTVRYAGEGREVTFSLDPATRRPVLRVVDVETKEVILQWPQAYVLQLAEDVRNK